VADPARIAARFRDQVAEGTDVDGRLDRGRGDLRGVGLAVDDRERLDLDDVKAAVEPQRDQVGLQVGVPAADAQPEQRVVEQRPGAVILAGEPLPGADVAQLERRVAADVTQVRVADLADVEPEVVAEQGEQLRGAVVLDLRLELVAAGDREPRLAERGRVADVRRDLLLVHAGRVHQRAPWAAGVGGERGDRPGVVVDRQRAAAKPVKARVGRAWRLVAVHRRLLPVSGRLSQAGCLIPAPSGVASLDLGPA